MSHHSSDYEIAAADLSEYFGQPIFYQDSSLSQAIEIPDAVVHPERVERRKRDHGWDRVQVREVYFSASYVTARMDASIQIGCETFSIDELGTASGNRTWLKLKRTLAGEVSRPRARG